MGLPAAVRLPWVGFTRQLHVSSLHSCSEGGRLCDYPTWFRLLVLTNPHGAVDDASVLDGVLPYRAALLLHVRYKLVDTKACLLHPDLRGIAIQDEALGRAARVEVFALVLFALCRIVAGVRSEPIMWH